MDDLLADFVAETREMLEASGGEIVAWEADPSDGTIGYDLPFRTHGRAIAASSIFRGWKGSATRRKTRLRNAEADVASPTPCWYPPCWRSSTASAP